MRIFYAPLFFFFFGMISGTAQTATEVYLFDFNEDYTLSNPVNVSENPGVYDNQPSFIDEKSIAYVSTRNGQTDIKVHNFWNGKDYWVTDTEASEYSPLLMNSGRHVSSIRLEKDGTQQLYSYNIRNIGEERLLINDIVIGYHVWFKNKTLVSFVLGDESSLVVTQLKGKKNINTTRDKNIGRALHNIPDTKLVSYISKKNEQWEVRSLDPKTGATEKIIHTLPQSEDMCWDIEGVAIMGKDELLYKFDPEKDTDWVLIASLEKFDLKGITRLAISPDGSKIAIVVSE